MITLNKQWLSLGNTCVSNAFLQEFMPVAKGDYIKVYFYGLMYAQNQQHDISIGLMAQELGMEEDEIIQAFQYWERRKLVIRLQDKPLKYEYIPFALAMSKGNKEINDTFTKFSDCVHSLFGERRKLHGNETSLAFEWVEELGIPMEVVMMLIQHMISTSNAGINFSFKTAQKMALKLKENNIKTVDEAEHYFSISQNSIKGAKSILNRFGKYRNPTEDELNLYIKWTQDWDLSQDSIIEACKETTKGDASFAYLDAILEGIIKRANGKIINSNDVRNIINKDIDDIEEIREMLMNLGMASARRNVNKGIKETYTEFKKDHSADIIKYAAYIVGQRGGKLDAVAETLKLWKSRNITNVDEAKSFINKISETDNLLRKIYDVLGQNLVPNINDRKQLQTWQSKYGFSNEMLIKCAEFAKGKQKPFAYMQKIFEAWKEKNINTVAEVEAAHDAYKSKKIGTAKEKNVVAQNYTQRNYTEDEYNIWEPNFDNEDSKNE